MNGFVDTCRGLPNISHRILMQTLEGTIQCELIDVQCNYAPTAEPYGHICLPMLVHPKFLWMDFSAVP